LATTSQLCQQIEATVENDDYHLINRYILLFVAIRVDLIITKSTNSVLIIRLFCLVLILPASTATTECTFSAIKCVKISLQNKMEDGFLRDCLKAYIEKEIVVIEQM
jgi:hypothetical protein